jgi:hypothetical protein
MRNNIVLLHLLAAYLLVYLGDHQKPFLYDLVLKITATPLIVIKSAFIVP